MDPSDNGINKVLVKKRVQRSVRGREVRILESIFAPHANSPGTLLWGNKERQELEGKALAALTLQPD